MIPLSDPDTPSRRRPFVYELTLSDKAAFFYTFGLIPAEMTMGIAFTTLPTPTGPLDITTPLPSWGTLFTSMFMHGDWMHFGSNMVYRWVFGDNIESRMGHVPYLAFYLGAGAVAGWVQIAIDPGSQIPTIGASGAIAGVLGAYLVLYPRNRINTLGVYGFLTVIRIRAFYLLGFWILLQFFGGLGSLGPSTQTGGVAYWAHIGGFLAGVTTLGLYRLVWRRHPGESEPFGP